MEKGKEYICSGADMELLMRKVGYVRVVWCKDCKYMEKYTDTESTPVSNTIKRLDLIGSCERHNVFVKADDYCSVGEET